MRRGDPCSHYSEGGARDGADGKPASADVALLARKGGATASGFRDSTPDAASFKQPAPGPSLESRTAKRVLIVEDSVLDMKLFRDLFGARGYAVLEATNGSEALDLARRCRPDLILVDVDLVRESGLEVVRRIKADAAIASAPMIAVSVFLGAGDRARLRDCGCENWFAKPVPVSGLIAVCDRLCPPRDDATAARS